MIPAAIAEPTARSDPSTANTQGGGSAIKTLYGRISEWVSFGTKPAGPETKASSVPKASPEMDAKWRSSQHHACCRRCPEIPSRNVFVSCPVDFPLPRIHFDELSPYGEKCWFGIRTDKSPSIPRSGEALTPNV